MIFDEFDSFFNRAFNDFYGTERFVEQSRYEEPIKDIWEDNNKVYVTIELPGIEEKDIQLTVRSNFIEIVAPRNDMVSARFYRNERLNDGYYARIIMPSRIKTEPIKKTFSNGVLELIFEKEKSNIEVR